MPLGVGPAKRIDKPRNSAYHTDGVLSSNCRRIATCGTAGADMQVKNQNPETGLSE